MTIVVTGKTSMIGQHLQKHAGTSSWRFLGHDEALQDKAWQKDCTCLINLAFSPALRLGEYAPENDIDSHLARSIRESQAHFIMMSSRTVYGPAPAPDYKLIESMPPAPETMYAKNKLQIEKILVDTLGHNRVTLIRGANVFGHEAGRQSFFGIALSRLREKGEIYFDMNPDVRRDFLAVWHVANALVVIARNPEPGLYNLGSGFPTSCRDIAQWLIDGYGSGNIRSGGQEYKDPFYMDMTHTHSTYALPDITPDILKADCINCGKTLRDAT